MDFFTGTDPVSVKLAVDSLAARYVDYCDHRDWDGVVGLFEDDGVFDAGELYGRSMTGPDELRSFYTGVTLPAAHHITSGYLTDITDDRVEARLKMITFFTGRQFSIDYLWTVTRAKGPWRIAHQRIELVGKVALVAH